MNMKIFMMLLGHILVTFVAILLQVLSVLIFFGVPLLIIVGIWNLLF